MLIEHECQFQFRTYTVRTADQHRFTDAFEVELKEPSEASYLTHYAGYCSPRDMLLHQLYRFVARLKVYSCCLITV